MNVIENSNAEILDSTYAVYDVSVCVITYNKEKYIEDAINSVLMQKTTCRYEIVVGDNASTDKTGDILKKYWGKDPDKFAVILNDTNLGLTTNMYNTMRKAKGKYIIILYGDDYWIDKNKMQSQFDFLESYAQYVGVTSSIESRYDGEKTALKIFPCPSMRDAVCTLADYLKGYDFPMAGVMFRNDIFSRETDHFKKMLYASLNIDDLSFCILLLMKGNVYILPKVMAVYRCFKKGDNAENFNSINPKVKRDCMSIELLNNLGQLTDNSLNLSTRYGLILASSCFSVIKKDLTMKDYRKIEQEISRRYKAQRKRILIKGLCRKILLVAQGR